MEKYDKLVEALRCGTNRADKNHNCEKCRYYSNGCLCTIAMDDAAAAIEALQAEVDTLKRTDIKRCQECLYLGQPVGEQLLPKLGEWVEENRRPRSSQFVCSECHRTAYDPQPTRDKAWRKRCRYAYCPNCGAKMEPTKEDA